MADCALVEGLRDRLGLDDPAAALGAVGSRFGVSVSLPGLDLAGLGAITGSLGLDTAPLQAAGGEVSARLTALAGDLDPERLIAPLLRPVQQAEQLAGADPAALLQRITQRIEGGRDSGLAKLERVIGEVAAGADAPALQGVVALGRALLPALPEGPLAPLGTWGGGLKVFLLLAGALMAVDSRARLIEAGPAAAWTRLAPWREGRLKSLAAWAEHPLDRRVATAPDDPAVKAALVDYLGALDQTLDLLETSLGTAELALAYEDPERAATQLVALEPLLAGTDAAPLRALCEDLVARLSGPLGQAGDATAGLGLEAQVDRALGFVAELQAAVDRLDAAALAAPVRGAIEELTGGLQRVADGLDQGLGAITLALHQVRDAVRAVDLRPLTEALRRVVQPIAEALQRLDALLADVMAGIAEAMGLAQAAIDTVKTAILEAAGSVKAAFDRLAAAVRRLDLPGKVAQLQAGIDTVAGELQRIRLEPFFDTSREVMDTAADALRLVPVDLLPDDLRQELVEVCATVRAIDFEGDVRLPLTTQLQSLLAEFDRDLLGQVAVFHGQLVAFLEGIDPAGPIAELERRFDTELIAPLQAFDPDALLAPLREALAEAQRRIAAVDLRGTLLAPIEAGFAQVLGFVDQADPAVVLQPLNARLAEVRGQVEQALRLQHWADTLDQTHARLQGLLEGLDLERLLPQLESGWRLMLEGLRDIPGGGALGGVVTMLLGRALPVAPDSWATVTRWLAEGGAAADLARRVHAGRAQLLALPPLLQAQDLAGLAARLGALHARLRSAVEALPADHPLRQRHAQALQRSPAERLAALAAARDRLLAQAQRAAGTLAPLEASAFGHSDLARDRLREALLPLEALKQQVLGLARRFGVDPTGRDLGAVFAQILGALRPARVLAALQPLIESLRARLGEWVQQGLVAPLKAGIVQLQALIARFDLTPIVAELSGIHAAVRAQIAALDPAALLGDVLAAFETVRDHLAGYDPLAPAREAIAAFQRAVAELAAPGSPVRPTVLFGGVVAAQQEITAAVRGIEVRQLLRPVLEALAALVVQLDEGLAGSETAFEDLQAALPAA